MIESGNTDAVFRKCLRTFAELPQNTAANMQEKRFQNRHTVFFDKFEVQRRVSLPAGRRAGRRGAAFRIRVPVEEFRWQHGQSAMLTWKNETGVVARSNRKDLKPLPSRQYTFVLFSYVFL